jgi:hypothetical protein
MKRAAQDRAPVLSKKDATQKKARTAQSEVETSSESDVETATAAEARKTRDRELKRTLQANEALDRQLADAEAKHKAKLAQLAALRNSYPVN